MEDKANSGNTAAEVPEKATTPVKKTARSKGKMQKSAHPPTSEMVNAAIKELKERKGSSLQAIKKYMAATYKIDGEKFAPFIRRYLKAAVASGAVVQTKGKGASGSFKLASAKSTESKAKIRPKRKTEPKKVASVEKKTVSVRKPAAVAKKASPAKKPAESGKNASAQKKTAAKPAAAEKSKAKVEAKALSKTKKSTKTRTPKPKKTAASKSIKSSAKK
ncbi:hypothetical protein KM043_003980 [Ampulex compressa]|nr:hypothetical protein KM043_003980 [Ampulex compressa]